ncbi:MAG TPA: nucleotide excision repair endonuclease [Vicinamibacterales bacterium]|nr:nucleotide excision repair endonuclease [Vicinamibacterales bacterium]
MPLLRDKLVARLSEMGAAPDHQRLASEVLGIRGASPELARRLVAQALVLEDRRDAWRRAGERICRDAPAAPGVYILRDADGRALYVGKAVNLRRRLRAHFAERRWRALKPDMARAADAEWREVGSDLEALLREASLIEELRPSVNVHTGAPDLDARAIPRALVRDVIVVMPSIEADSVELITAAADGRTMMQRTRRSGGDLAVHAQRIMRFFHSALARSRHGDTGSHVSSAPIVFSWLAQHGDRVTRLDPHDVRSPRELRTRLAALFRDGRLFHERLHQC